MKLVDLNVLLYATDSESRHHDTAKPWLDAAMRGAETVGLPTAVTVGYVRLTTNPRVLIEPLTPGESVTVLDRWFRRPNVVRPEPTARHFTLLVELLEATGTGGNLVPDAHLGALALEHGADLVSYDNDFARFPGVRWIDPSVA